MLDAEGRALRAELIDLFGRGVAEPLDDDAFDVVARRCFEFQYGHNSPYAAFCRRRGRTPDAVGHWTEIPAVPTVAFKEVALVCGSTDDADTVFLTSGTTRGPERRGRHYVLDLSLYHAALLPVFAAYLLPDREEMPMLSLVPPAAQMAASSLAHMVAVVVDRLGSAESGCYAAVGSGIDVDALDDALRGFEADGRPVCLLGTALAFARWTDALERRGVRYALPDGSRLMDTGGFKGRRRRIPEDELRARYADRLGIPPDRCVNEYGMTEMLSQSYDTVLRERVVEGRAGPRRKRAPPWVRTVVVDPDTLEPVPAGRDGLLRHHDLANLLSVSAIQTADLGRASDDGDGFVVLGRAAGAQPRGCSVAMDILLDAVEKEGRG